MSIIDLSKYRKPKDESLEYFCLKCNSSFWRIKADGRVFCGDCGSLMNNLKVSCEPSGHLPQ